MSVSLVFYIPVAIFLAIILFEVIKYAFIRMIPADVVEGTPLFRDAGKNSYSVGVELRFPVRMKLHKLQNEFYVDCSHPDFLRFLKENKKIRAIAERLFESGFEQIKYDGKILWIQTYKKRESTAADLEILVNLRDIFSEIKLRIPYYSFPSIDNAIVPSVMMALVAICDFILFIKGYIHFNLAKFNSSSVFIEPFYIHLNPLSLVLPGFLPTIIFVVLFFVLEFFLFRDSSILSISVLVLFFVFSIPIGVEIVSCANRYLDSSKELVVVEDIVNTSKERHYYGRTYGTTEYYLLLKSETDLQNADLPDKIKVSYEIYNKVRVGDKVEFHIGDGWLGMPWYREILVRYKH